MIDLKSKKHVLILCMVVVAFVGVGLNCTTTIGINLVFKCAMLV